MKFPSIIRTPRHQRFNLEPRYYDPVKEELQEREDRIKRTLLLNDSKKNIDDAEGYSAHSSLRGAFIQNRRSKSGSTSFLQLIIMFLLAGLIFGYIYFGNIALYIVLTISSVLLYFKIKRRE